MNEKQVSKRLERRKQWIADMVREFSYVKGFSTGVESIDRNIREYIGRKRK